MIDIVTNHSRAKSDGLGGVEVSTKVMGRTHYKVVPRAQLPSDHDLAMMHERTFDRLCFKIITGIEE